MLAQPEYLPTPEQIAAMCAEIRAGWTPAEHRRRKVDKSEYARFETPVITPTKWLAFLWESDAKTLDSYLPFVSD